MKPLVEIKYNSDKFVTGESFERLKKEIIKFGQDNGITENQFLILDFKVDYNKKPAK